MKLPRKCRAPIACEASLMCYLWADEGEACWKQPKKRRSNTHRATMGQDWGGRWSNRSPGDLKPSSEDVYALASDLEVSVFREGYAGTWSMWFIRGPHTNYTLGQTNRQAMLTLRHNDRNGWPWERASNSQEQQA